ncbi:MAG: Eco29kI family restriction endonuclease [Planktomarina sp.]
MPAPFNPLDKVSLAEAIQRKLMDMAPVSFDALKPFEGVGLYAIYYDGDFECYRRAAKANAHSRWQVPFYVGKAVPKGSRKGALLDAGQTSNELSSRLQKHAATITAAENLNLRDFHVRYLCVDPIWIPLGESLMISEFGPIWNKLLDGFGNNDPGSGRYNQLRSRWDTLHPGRTWAEKCKVRPDQPKDLVRDVEEFFAART